MNARQHVTAFRPSVFDSKLLWRADHHRHPPATRISRPRLTVARESSGREAVPLLIQKFRARPTRLCVLQ